MKSIKAELRRIFLSVIIALTAISIGFLLMHMYVVGKYKAVSEASIQEYRLLTVASSLSNSYNTRYLSNDVSTNAANQQLQSAQATIKQITTYLDVAIVDPQSKADYIGLKNTLNALLGTINESLVNLSRSNIADYSADHDQIVQEYGFVQDNATTLIFSQLTYANSISASLNRTYQLSEVIGISIL